MPFADYYSARSGLITSSISLQEYKDRAIDNALQNIINDKNLHLNSFRLWRMVKYFSIRYNLVLKLGIKL